MPLQPAILEMGMGIDLHGRDYTRAARRAVWNAVHQSSLMFLNLFGPDTAREMIVQVTVGVPKPEEVREEEVLSVLPHGKGVLKVVPGGLEIEGREGSGNLTIMANAAVIVNINMT